MEDLPGGASLFFCRRRRRRHRCPGKGVAYVGSCRVDVAAVVVVFAVMGDATRVNGAKRGRNPGQEIPLWDERGDEFSMGSDQKDWIQRHEQGREDARDDAFPCHSYSSSGSGHQEVQGRSQRG